MPRAQANGIELEYETFGEPSQPSMLLIMGLSCQMLLWPEGFCELLAGRGFYVIRYDNRDVGLSTKDDAWSATPYSLDDMATDAVGLLDAVGVERVHLVGQSMGGMIAQIVAVTWPERVLSLCSLSSTTGDKTVGQPHPELLESWTANAPPRSRDEAVEAHVRTWRSLASSAFMFDEAYVRDRGGRCYDRDHSPMGTLRQIMAIAAAWDRTARLAELSVPTVVIHGDIDPLVDISGGEATAKAIPDAELLTIPGMGHDIPQEAWPILVDAIASNAERASNE